MAHGRLARRRQFSVARRGESATAEKTETAEGAEGEEFEFQAEVGRVMDIIINSLYSNKDCYHGGGPTWSLGGRWEKKKHGCFEILLNLSGNHLSG